ncbi:hypothetical protein ABW21_db0201051 [Orbilia brochopaga]|nr:hypothetical protein ABW21_db0201051 [Drechslerella brochopaga]
MAVIRSETQEARSHENMVHMHEVTDNRLQRMLADGQEFLKACNSQLQRMSDRKLLSRGGSKVHQLVRKHQDAKLDEKAVIAFIGESGAGKSTLLNALLDYENMVPTSGIRACTSVATEFRGRTSDMTSKFHAVIEYINQDDFLKEAEILHQDIIGYDEPHYEEKEGPVIPPLLDEDDIEESHPTLKRCRLSDSASGSCAAVARAKLKALFPTAGIGNFEEMKSKIARLYRENSHLSSGRQELSSNDETKFTDQIHDWIGNHEDDERDGGPHLWPLIKVIKIYLDSEVLQSDAVLVDLPGLKDYNAARTTVAQSYLARANEIVIVSRLTRVLTDETTTALAEMGYTKQLQYDGRKRITIVCSFCDRNNQVPVLLQKAYSDILGGNVEVKAFLVASKEYQERIVQLDLGDDDSEIAKDTQIPALREHCIRIPTEQKLNRSKFLINEISRAFTAAKFLVDGPGVSLTKLKREAITTELEKAAKGMQMALTRVQSECSTSIKREVENIIKQSGSSVIDAI